MLITRIRHVLSTLRRDFDTAREPSSELERSERNIRVNIYHGIVSIMSLNLAAPFMGIFAVRMGASDFQVGLLSSGPALVSLLSMIPGGRLVDRHPAKKRLLIKLVLAQRFFYLLLSTIPFFVPDRRAWMLVFCVALMNMPASIANIGWQAFISGLIPASRRADAFATRNRLMNLTGTVVVLLVGRTIDIAGFPLGYQLAFGAAFLMAIAEVWVFNKLDDSQMRPREQVSSAGQMRPQQRASNLKEVLSHKPFVRYTLVSIAFYLCWQIPWPLFTLYQVRVLGANNLWVSLLNLANTGGSLVGYGFWARQMNRHGSMRTLFLSSLGIFIVPMVYAFSNSLATITLFNLMTGAIFSGVNLALFNALLEVTPDGQKATYIAYYTTAVNSAAIAAPLIGVGLLNVYGYFWAFLIAAALRLGGSLLFLMVSSIEQRESTMSQAPTHTQQ